MFYRCGSMRCGEGSEGKIAEQQKRLMLYRSGPMGRGNEGEARPQSDRRGSCFTEVLMALAPRVQPRDCQDTVKDEGKRNV